MLDYISHPWPWYVSGLTITAIMTLLIIFGKNFGFSANLRTMCSIGGAGKVADFFDFNWKSQVWNLLFVLGSVLGGYIAVNYLSPEKGVEIADATVQKLQELGINSSQDGLVPSELFSIDSLSFKNIMILLVGGLLVGFGARYAGGCTSGHAISGLSNLQLPSLIAVLGFMVGGFIMTHFILPIIL